jgi:hypothetical protein
MGKGLEMTTFPTAIGVALMSALALSGCGSDIGAKDYGDLFKGAAIALNLTPRGGQTTVDQVDPAEAAQLRTALQLDGQPIYLVAAPSLKYLALMAPYGQNGDVQTWASTHYESISLRQGMLVASRGFGRDLMSSVTPSIAQIASGQGITNRRYYYLDGADQTQRFDFTCTLSPAGSEAIVILTKQSATRKVAESCVGTTGSFTNEYWFDHGANLRQSRQLVTPGMENLLMQRVID